MAKGKAVEIALTDAERAELERMIARQLTPQGLGTRARVVLLADAGMTNRQIAELLGLRPHRVGRWREKFAQSRIAGLMADRQAPSPARADPK
jgi:DNA-binding CsgD family transcriptional regulator